MKQAGETERVCAWLLCAHSSTRSSTHGTYDERALPYDQRLLAMVQTPENRIFELLVDPVGTEIATWTLAKAYCDVGNISSAGTRLFFSLPIPG